MSIGTHTVVLTYNGDVGKFRTSFAGIPAEDPAIDGWLPANSITFTYTRASVAAAALPSQPTGSVAFSTAPQITNATPTGSTTSSTTKSTNTLSPSGVDGFFASTTTTNSTSTPRTLAGALAKVHSGDDWLGGAL
jgi:hypothetical protein